MEQQAGTIHQQYQKAKRKTKYLLIDANGRGAQVLPYSLRARKGAKVSMPITWDELSTIAPDGVDIREALQRINSDDPWRGFFENNQLLK